MKWFQSETHRAYLYRIVTAAIPVLILAGILSPEDATVWLGLAAAVLGLGAGGLAVRNTTTKPAEVSEPPPPFDG